MTSDKRATAVAPRADRVSGRTALPFAVSRADATEEHARELQLRRSTEARLRFARFLRESLAMIFAEATVSPDENRHQVELPSLKLQYTADGRIAFDEPFMENFQDLRMTTGDQAANEPGVISPEMFLSYAPSAILEVAADLVEGEGLSSRAGNTLSAVGNLVSVAVRRALLREALHRKSWNLTAVGVEFGLGGSGNVLRMIRDLGLEEELDAARRDGSVKRGRPRKEPVSDDLEKLDHK